MIKDYVLLGAGLIALAASPLVQAAGSETPDRADLEAKLEQTREEIRRLSERLAELSLELVDEPMRQLHHRDGPMIGKRERVAMGVTIQSAGSEQGARVLAVTPDGPADRAGIRTGDIILGLGDDSVTDGGPSAGAQIIRYMREVEAGDTVVVRLQRDGEPLEVDLVAEALEMPAAFDFDFDMEVFEDLGENIQRHVFRSFKEDGAGAIELGEEGGFEFFFRAGAWSDMEVVALTPGLGDYFGVSDGLLIVRAPQDAGTDLRDGDVIVRVAGETLADRRELGRALANARHGDIVRFDIVRQRQSMTVDATVPRNEMPDGDRGRIVIKRYGVDED